MQFRTGSPYDDYLLAQAQRALGIAANERAVEGFWSKPQSTHDPDLIDLATNKVRADLRQAVLDLLYNFWGERYVDPEAWSTVWIAGSALAYQWDRDDADLDILIGVDHAKFYELNPAYRDTPEPDMDRHFNEEFDRDLEPQTKSCRVGLLHGRPVLVSGAWEAQGSVNPSANNTRGTTPPSGQSQPLPSSGDAPRSLSRDTSPLSEWVSTRTQRGSGPASAQAPTRLHQSAQGAAGGESSATETASAAHVARNTDGSRPGGASTASSRPSTTDSAVSSRDGARSAAKTPASDTSYASTTATTPDGSAGFSASRATYRSGTSATTSRGCVVPSHIFDAEGGRYTGRNVWEITAYVNPRAADIRAISPYAAYNLSADEWTVEPDMLDPEWDPRTHFSEDWWKALDGDVSTARMLVDGYHDAVSRYVSFKPSDPRASSTLAQVRYYAQRSAALFDDIHEGRKSSFTKGGLGFYGWGNLRWQTHKHFGTVKALRDIRALHKDAMAAAAKATYGGVPEANTGRLAFDAATLANRAWIQRRLAQ